MDPDVPATALDVVRTAEPFNWKSSRPGCLQALERVGMGGKASLPFSSLSGGQKRRVLVAKALAGNPSLLILDEPTVNVDKETEESLERLLNDLCRAGEVGVIAATHARHWAQQARRYRIEGGRIRG
jgi:ABC-type Mn2+/Zn2+ transport system ATPase subunit